MRLERVNGNNIWELMELKVKDEQASFVASNTTSILEAYITTISGGYAMPFGIYIGNSPVGFLMIGFGHDDSWENPPSIADGNYSLWRLMIDARYQGMGYGTQAVGLALDLIRTFPCGPADFCWLSYEPDNRVARNLYHSYGFTETGEMDGEEVIAALELKG